MVVATLVGYFLSGDGDATGLHHRIKALLADVLRHLGHPARATAPGHPLLARLAAIEEELDGQGVGSVRSRRTVRATRSLLIATVPLILRSEGRNLMQPDLSEHLLSTAEDMTGPDSHSTSQQLARLVTNASVPQLKSDLDGLRTAFANWIGQQEKATTDPPGPQAPPVILHRDWIGAREAAVRAGGAMLVFGFLWQVTGWDLGAYMLLGLSVMISLFSTFENPPHIMRFIITGQVIGVAAALVCRWLVWPFAESELEQIVMLFPFVMLAPLLLSHARTMIASTDYSMVLLLLSQPAIPLTGDFTGSLLMGFAVLSAPLVALVGYLLIYPISLQRRQNHLIAMMMTDLAAIARNDLALKHRQVWQARFYHRSLRLVRISEKLARAEDRALNSCIAVLALARMAMICHELLQGTDSSNPVRRAARQVLARLQRISRDRQHLVTALEQLAVRLPANEATIIPIAIKALKRSL